MKLMLTTAALAASLAMPAVAGDFALADQLLSKKPMVETWVPDEASKTALAAAPVQGAEFQRMEEPGFLLFDGDIKNGDELRFYNKLHDGKGRVTSVMLNSAGGSVKAASDIAAQIEQAGIETIVAGGDICASACVMIFAAGSHRTVQPDSQIGVHSVATFQNAALEGTGVEDDNAMALTVWEAREMQQLGVPAGVIAAMVTTPPDSVHWLSESEIGNWAEMVETPNQGEPS